jgi:transposase
MKPKRPFSDLDWLSTPAPVRQYILQLEATIEVMQEQIKDLQKLAGRVEQLEARLNKNSRNSSKPPSSDSPYSKPKRSKKAKSKKSRGGQKGHQGHRRQMLDPTRVEQVTPSRCPCGHHGFDQQAMTPFYTHQHIELQRIPLNISHFVLNKCACPECGKTVKASLPASVCTGYGPRLSAFIGELSGLNGMSRKDVKRLCGSVLGLPISTGAIQKIIDRVSLALEPAYQAIGRIARSAKCNYIDETSWYKDNSLNWLWAMVNDRVALYRVDPKRSKEAFGLLVEDWQGILVSDGYGLYRSWVHGRQTCLAHLIRKADGLAERRKPNLRICGHMAASFLRQLVHFANSPPDPKTWNQFYRQLLLLLSLFEEDIDDAGRLARQMLREIDSLWFFLDHHGVEPTNNQAERALRCGVLWRKRSLGTQSDKGNRWVERILSLKETCRLKDKPTFPVMVELIRSNFNNSSPDLAWI